jgi:hypothetical protein
MKMSLRNHDSGPFDPEPTLADFSRPFVVLLGHEDRLIGRLLDGVDQPLISMEHGVDGEMRSGIEDWRGGTRLTPSVQRLMDFELEQRRLLRD